MGTFVRALASAEVDVIIDKQGRSTPTPRQTGQHASDTAMLLLSANFHRQPVGFTSALKVT